MGDKLEKKEETETIELEPLEPTEQANVETIPCANIPEHMKPLFDCCKEFEEGKIGSDDFFAKALINTGEFMQKVKERKQEENSEETMVTEE